MNNYNSYMNRYEQPEDNFSITVIGEVEVCCWNGCYAEFMHEVNGEVVGCDEDGEEIDWEILKVCPVCATTISDLIFEGSDVEEISREIW